MAALNRDETNTLRDVETLMDHILKNGYDPAAKDKNNEYVEQLLKNHKAHLNTVIQMKGYYPS